jgi:hypothetical protein
MLYEKNEIETFTSLIGSCTAEAYNGYIMISILSYLILDMIL